MKIEDRFWSYVTGIENGTILSNKWIQLCVRRFREDIEKSKNEDYPYYFSFETGERIVKFAELLKQTNDKWAGQPLVLLPWEVFALCNIYGWLDKKTNTRRFRKAWLFVGRKNGKSVLVSTCCLWDILITHGGQCSIAASTRQQASIVFDVVKAMVNQNDILSKKLKIYESTKTITNAKNFSKIFALSSESKKTGDGLNVSCGIFDECSATDFGIYKIVESGQGSRPEPLNVLISSGSDNQESMGYSECLYGQKVLQNIIQDDSYFCMLYGLDENDDWHDESLYIKANPSLNETVSPDFLHKLKIQAEQVPSLQGEFLSKNLCLWVSNESSWISHDLWQVNMDNDKKFKFDKDKPYYANIGIDLSKTNDLTVATLCVYQEGKFFMKHLLYFPKDSLGDRIKRETELWRNWFSTGVVTALPGKVIDYEFIFNDIRKLAEQFNIEEILIDPYNSSKVVAELESSFTIVPIPQNLKNLSPYTKDYQEEILNGNIVDSNPFMNWAMSNAMVYTDANGNIKVIKNSTKGDRGNMHIDPVITSLMCVGRIKSLLLTGDIDLRDAETVARDTKNFLSKLSF